MGQGRKTSDLGLLGQEDGDAEGMRVIVGAPVGDSDGDADGMGDNVGANVPVVHIKTASEPTIVTVSVAALPSSLYTVMVLSAFDAVHTSVFHSLDAAGQT